MLSASPVSVAEPRVGAKTSRQLAQCALGAAQHGGSNGALGSVSPARTRGFAGASQTPVRGHSFHDKTTALRSVRAPLDRSGETGAHHVPCSSWSADPGCRLRCAHGLRGPWASASVSRVTAVRLTLPPCVTDPAGPECHWSNPHPGALRGAERYFSCLIYDNVICTEFPQLHIHINRSNYIVYVNVILSKQTRKSSVL